MNGGKRCAFLILQRKPENRNFDLQVATKYLNTIKIYVNQLGLTGLLSLIISETNIFLESMKNLYLPLPIFVLCTLLDYM